jgi:hypothetical protein
VFTYHVITLEAYIEGHLVGVDIVEQLKIEVTFILPCCWFSLTNEKEIGKRWIKVHNQQIKTEDTGSGGDVSGLYSGGSRFEFRLG